MMSQPNESWFTEACAECGMAMSLLGCKRLHEEHSAYQRLEVFATEKFGRLLVLDGFVMLTERDNYIYHEMLVHPALFAHPAPRRVLIIGGGDCGTLREVLRHTAVEQVTQVELDERVTRVCEQYFPDLCSGNHDPRADLRFADGIAWVRDCPDASIDVILVDSTDPIGPAQGLFSEAFFRHCRRVLRPGGLLAQQSESPLVHIDKVIRPMHLALKAAGFADVRLLHFPQPTYPTGWWSVTLAGRDDPVTFAREALAAERSLPLRYYNTDCHRAAMALPESIRQALS